MVNYILKYSHDLDPEIYNKYSSKRILYWPLKYNNTELIETLKEQGFTNSFF